jgi:hypothetical protein
VRHENEMKKLARPESDERGSSSVGQDGEWTRGESAGDRGQQPRRRREPDSGGVRNVGRNDGVAARRNLLQRIAANVGAEQSGITSGPEEPDRGQPDWREPGGNGSRNVGIALWHALQRSRAGRELHDGGDVVPVADDVDG